MSWGCAEGGGLRARGRRCRLQQYGLHAPIAARQRMMCLNSRTGLAPDTRKRSDMVVCGGEERALSAPARARGERGERGESLALSKRGGWRPLSLSRARALVLGRSSESQQRGELVSGWVEHRRSFGCAERGGSERALRFVRSSLPPLLRRREQKKLAQPHQKTHTNPFSKKHSHNNNTQHQPCAPSSPTPTAPPRSRPLPLLPPAAWRSSRRR